MTMPAQKPGKSKQDYQTPPELIKAVCKRLGIKKFDIDLAADQNNRVTDLFFSMEDDALARHNRWYPQRGAWCWLNPPFSNIQPWVEKAASEALMGSQICVLIPSSVGSDWWRDHVENNAYVLHLNGRLTFVGASDPYPKDCSLLLYVPWRATGSQVWNWRNV